ncbi:MAG: ferrochelatase [Sphingomonadales bacterium]
MAEVEPVNGSENRDRRIAVVLMNLGGPDNEAAVQPFLFNLFSDPQIIRLPNPLRWLVARIISRRRAPVAREIYANIGGKSPILEETDAQAVALEAELDRRGITSQVFVTMRYWHPFAQETVEAVKAFQPDEVVLLPLYPQFSTTTSQSSLMDWERAARATGLDAPARQICCYPLVDDFIQAHAALLIRSLEKAGYDIAENLHATRVLFSAHGLPRKIVDAGDPYPLQIEATARALAQSLPWTGLDWRISYQSRVGPLEWIGPDTETEIVAAGRDGKAIVVVPIAFVSEHSETLVELDIEYRDLALKSGVSRYIRVPALGIEDHFIRALGDVVMAGLDGKRADGWQCPSGKTCLRGRIRPGGEA